MISKIYSFCILACILVLLASCASEGIQNDGKTLLYPSDNIQKAIDSLPKDGGVLYLAPGEYLLTKGIWINRSNVKLVGSRGTILKLEANVNEPVILIGSNQEIPNYYIRNIEIENIKIDGNKAEQKYELDQARPWIRNNDIDVRMVENLWIEKVELVNARSGGCVISWGTRKVFIDSSIFKDSFFDGIALYACEDVIVSNFISENNSFAGISLDNYVLDTMFVNGIVKNNGDVGIFARESKDVSFHNVVVSGNKNNGCFLSHSKDNSKGSGTENFFFSNCIFRNNKGWGIWLATTEILAPGNTVSSCRFFGNSLGAIHLDKGGKILESNNVFTDK